LGEWEEADRNPSNLLTGGKLSQYEEWATGEDISLTTAERGFVDASIERRTGETRERRARRRRIMAGFAAAAVVALLLAVVAFVQSGKAEENARRATASELATRSMMALPEDPERAILLALEAVDLSRSAGEQPLPSAIDALRQATRWGRPIDGGDALLAVSPDGRWMVLNEGWNEEGGVPNPNAIVYDFEGEEQARLVGDAPISDLAISPKGGLVAAGADLAISPNAGLVAASYNTSDLIERAAVVLFDPLTGEEVIRLAGPPQDYRGLDFSLDGRRLIAGSEPVMAWDVETGEEVASLPADVFGAWFLFGGEELLVTLEGERPGLGFFSIPGGELTDVLGVEELFPRQALEPDRTRVTLTSLAEVLLYDPFRVRTTRKRILDLLSGWPLADPSQRCPTSGSARVGGTSCS
jgi:hypothetical protein